jgi:hypothetical protein
MITQSSIPRKDVEQLVVGFDKPHIVTGVLDRVYSTCDTVDWEHFLNTVQTYANFHAHTQAYNVLSWVIYKVSAEIPGKFWQQVN